MCVIEREWAFMPLGAKTGGNMCVYTRIILHQALACLLHVLLFSMKLLSTIIIYY